MNNNHLLNTKFIEANNLETVFVIPFLIAVHMLSLAMEC